MQRIRHPQTWCIGPMLLALFALALFASPANAHDVHEHAAEHGHAPAPSSHALHKGTARSLLQAFRATGEDAHLDRAWSLVEPRLNDNDVTAELLIDAALVAQARHQFDTAIELTRNALEIDSRDDQAWLLLASIHLVTGEIELAKQACGELGRAPWLVIIGCEARVAHASGSAAEVRPSFERLLAVAEETRVEPAALAWALSVAGDLAVASNDADRAIEHFDQSLSLVENTQVRSALVDVLLANDRLTEAQAVLEKGSGALPLDVRRLILAKRQGRIAEVADRVAEVDREFRKWIAAEDWLHAREMARFYLDVVDCPQLARRLAQINFTIQKEYEDKLLYRRVT